MEDELLALALVGSRAPGYQHDSASKLQSLVMALEEIGERAEQLDDTSLTLAVEAANEAARELTSQLQAFRALARGTTPSATPLRLLFERAAARAGVRLRGELPALDVALAAPEAVQALALLLDGAAGRGVVREVEVEVSVDAHGCTLPLGAAPEVIAVARYAFRRSGGDLRATADAVRVTWSGASA